MSRRSMRNNRSSRRSMRSRRNHRRLRNHRPNRRPARNRRRRRRRRSHDLRALPWQGHNAPRRRSNWSHSRSRRNRSMSGSRRLRRNRRTSRNRRRRSDHSCRTWRMATRIGLSLPALQNRLQRVAGLRHMRQVERRLRLNGRLARSAARRPVVEVAAHLFGLVGLDGTGVRLSLRHANRRQSVQNGPALDFKLPCEIVDSNFAHPSLCLPYASIPCALSCSYQPHRSGNLSQLYYYP